MTQAHSLSPLKLVMEIKCRWSLIAQLTHREAFARYKHSFLGIFWSFVTPLCLLAIYTFVFSEVFQAKWGGNQDGNKLEFAVIIFSGLSIFNFFAECISKAPMLILNNPNYVKKLVFPLELLPVIVVFSATINLFISIAVLIVFQYLALGVFYTTALAIPLVVLPLHFSVLGLVWFLASLGVFIRDIGQTIGIVITGLMFLSPVFFPTSAFPEKWQFLLNLNPVALPIDQARAVLVLGQQPDWSLWAINLVIGGIVCCLGLSWFQLTRRGFADVI